MSTHHCACNGRAATAMHEAERVAATKQTMGASKIESDLVLGPQEMITQLESTSDSIDLPPRDAESPSPTSSPSPR